MNENPTVFTPTFPRTTLSFKDGLLEIINPSTIFELIRDIKDPEHPMTLEQLGVVSLDFIKVYVDDLTNNDANHKAQLHPMASLGSPIPVIIIKFVPTIPHCSMASFIGLSIRLHVIKYIPLNYSLEVEIVSDSHVQYRELNKQFNDKDRINAASENVNLREMIEDLLPVYEK